MLAILLIVALVAIFAFIFRSQLSRLIRRAIGEFEMSVRESFRLYSQKLNVFVTLVVLPYIIATNGGFVAEIVALLPETYRPLAGMLSGMIAFGAVTWARLRVQPSKGELGNGL